jgi:hypothetical protein
MSTGFFTTVSQLGIRTGPALLVLLAFQPATIAAADSIDVRSVAAIAKRVGRQHFDLLHCPGGISIGYRLEVEQDKSKPIFIYRQGLDGLVVMKWPKLRCRVEGPMSGIWVEEKGRYVEKTQQNVREAAYNFETKGSVAHDGDMMGELLNARESFSADCAFPLRFQAFAEADQYYVLGEPLETDYWLPDALLSHPYVLGPSEQIADSQCLTLSRPGIDKLWIADQQGFVLRKREFHHAQNGPLRFRLENSDIRQVRSGVWMPYHQISEENDGSGRLLMRLSLHVRDVQFGTISDATASLKLPSTVQYIEDHITSRTYRRVPKNTDMGLMAKRAKQSLVRPGQNAWLKSVLLLNISLALLIFFYSKHIKRL